MMVSLPATDTMSAAVATVVNGAHSARPTQVRDADLPALEMQVHWVRDIDELQAWVPRWHRLVEMAAETNVFYEPEFLLPALRHLRGNGNVGVALVTAPPRVHPAGEPVLCGLFPLKIMRQFNGMPVRVAELWRHEHCFLTTPLIRRDVIGETWESFWSARNGGIGGRRLDWFSLPMTSGEGAVHSMWLDWSERNQIRTLVRRRYRRASLSRAGSFEEFMSGQVPRKTRQESTRLRRKLEKEHGVTVVTSGEADAADALLQLELSGWKGREGTALSNHPQSREFIGQVISAMASAGRLQIHSFQIGARTIASKMNLTSGSQGFAFKIAYDEDFARYSPGMLLEVENIRQLHETGMIQSMDSCADPDHPMINHLWSGRRAIESAVFSCGSRSGEWLLALRPFVQKLSGSRKRKRQVQPERERACRLATETFSTPVHTI